MAVTDSPDPFGPYMVAFNASATIPESLSATKLIFGNVYQTASKTLNITVTNKASSGPITLTGANIDGANVGDFSLAGGTCTGTLSASSSCTYAVTFTPSTETAESAAISIGVAEAPNGGPSAVGLTGTGLTPIKLSPAVSLSFESIGPPQPFVSRTVTVYNYGGRTVSLSESITGTDASAFAVTGGSCGSTLESGGSSCTYTLRYMGPGPKSATLGVSAVGDAASPHNVSLKAGLIATPTATVSATPLATATASPTVTATGTPSPTPTGTPDL